MAITSYEDLQVYQEGYGLAIEIHKLSQEIPRQERYELGYQMRKAAVSIPANIAEGYGRKNSKKEFKHFLRNALGSVNEMKVYIDMMKDLAYIDKFRHEELKGKYEILGKKLYRLTEKWES